MRFSLFQKLYIHHRSSCGPGADRALCLARPAPCEGSAARGWIRGCGRVDTAWRPTAQAAIHPLGSAHSFCVSTRHHTDVTLTHTHSHSLTHTHTHTHGSGHRFCASAWHHTDVTHRHTHTLHSSAHSHSDTHIHTHTRLRTQLLCECLTPHRHTHTLFTAAHTHI